MCRTCDAEVWVAGNTATANYDFTDDGIFVYVHGRTERYPVIARDLVMVDRQGVARPVTDQRRDYWRPRLSRLTARAIAVEVFDGKAEHIWVIHPRDRQCQPRSPLVVW